MTEHANSLPKRTPFQRIAEAFPTVFALAVMAGGWWTIHLINHAPSTETDGSEAMYEQTAPSTLTLPEGKLKAGHFESAPAESKRLQHMHEVPGRLRYDETRHVDVKAPMDGILSEVMVTPGQQVEAGQLMAVLRSPEIGRARAAVLKQRDVREIAQQMFDRALTLEENLEEMLAIVDRERSMDAIEAAVLNRDLGKYRQDILSAYAKMKLSSELLASVQPLAGSGSISGRAVRERELERQITESAFRTARDQAAFEARQARLEAAADLAEADRQLNLAWQSVETLLGYKENRQTAVLDTEDALSRLEVRAPFPGTVESREFANNERVSRGDSLVELANTDSLYVAASIREGDWSAMSLTPGTKITVSVPALDDSRFEAEIRYLGRQVEADTNAVPLVATIHNDQGLLRPGMFVRVTVPIGEARQVLTINPESVVQHEDQEFVFLDMSGGTFKRVDVSTGQSSDDLIEVTEGLTPGQMVVTHGAFLLKSELLLQSEAE